MTKTMCGADCWTDHRLVVSKLNLRIQPARRPQGKKAPKRLDVSKLNKDSMRQDFLTDICNQLDAMNLSSEDPEENWTVFHKTVLSSAASTLGHPSRKHQDWFDENDDEIQRLLEEKHRLLKAHQDDTSSVSKKAAYICNICKTVQTKLRDMQDSWLRKKTEEIQSFADRKDMKKFHDALKTIYGPKSSGATTLLSADGNTLLTDKKVQVGKDQEKTQSEKDSHSKNRGGKKPNQQSGTYTTKHTASRMSSYFPIGGHSVTST